MWQTRMREDASLRCTQVWIHWSVDFKDLSLSDKIVIFQYQPNLELFIKISMVNNFIEGDLASSIIDDYPYKLSYPDKNHTIISLDDAKKEISELSKNGYNLSSNDQAQIIFDYFDI